MPRRVRISGGLFACLMTIQVHVAFVLFMPSALTKVAKQDAWLSVITAGLFGAGVAVLSVWAALQRPKLSPVQAALSIYGKWLGFPVALLYVGFYAWMFHLVLRNVLDFGSMVLLPGTPGRAIVSLMAAVTYYGVWHGLEPIVRVGFQTLVAIAIANIAMPFLLVTQISIRELAPILTHGLSPILQAALPAFGWLGEAFVAMTLVPHLSEQKNAYRWALIGVGAGTLILTFHTTMTILVMGPELPARFIYPVHLLVQQIAVAHILERIEIVLITVWLSGMYVKLTMLLFAASEGAGQLLGLKHHRWPAAVIAVGGVVATQFWPGVLDVAVAGASAWEQILNLSAEVGFPLLILVGSAIVGLLHQGKSANA